MSAAERMRRYRLRKAGRPDGRPRACLACGAIISIYTPLTDYYCAPCGKGRNATCKRGHDLTLTSRIVSRGNRPTTICAACKMDRDRAYARARRARPASVA